MLERRAWFPCLPEHATGRYPEPHDSYVSFPRNLHCEIRSTPRPHYHLGNNFCCPLDRRPGGPSAGLIVYSREEFLVLTENRTPIPLSYTQWHNHLTDLPPVAPRLMLYPFLESLLSGYLVEMSSLIFEDLQFVYLVRPKKLLPLYPNIFTPDSTDIRDWNVQGTAAVV